jgi:mevalonate kinase
MRSITASAPGKVILFGEHAVVWNFPAIAMAVSLRTSCSIKETNQNIVIEFPDYNRVFSYTDIEQLKREIPEKFQQFSFIFELLSKEYSIEFKNIIITIHSELFPESGLGSSASIAAAFITAVNGYYKLGMGLEGISKLAFKMEEITHGTPSGIDNTICTFAKTIIFQNGIYRYISIPKQLSILITYTNIKHNTKQAVSNIKKLKEKQPFSITKIFEKIGSYTEIAELELLKGNLVEVGDLMNINQKLLEELSLSNNVISEIINLAINNGAFGSKITGAGLGGCVITLGTQEILSNILGLLEEKGYKSLIVTEDAKGAMIEN